MDQDLIEAQGKAMALIAAMFQRGGIVSAEEFGSILAVFALSVDETHPAQGRIIATWAAAVKASAAVRTARLS